MHFIILGAVAVSITYFCLGITTQSAMSVTRCALQIKRQWWRTALYVGHGIGHNDISLSTSQCLWTLPDVYCPVPKILIPQACLYCRPARFSRGRCLCDCFSHEHRPRQQCVACCGLLCCLVCSIFHILWLCVYCVTVYVFFCPYDRLYLACVPINCHFNL